MALYTIKELYDYAKTTSASLMFGNVYSDPENIPPYVKGYLDAYNDRIGDILISDPDALISQKYGNFIFMYECESVTVALARFILNNATYCKLHNTELLRVYDAMTTDFNPLDNYDRTEITTDSGTNTSGATSKTAPDDSEIFYNVGSAAVSGTNNNTRQSHIHGNIGVVDTVTLISNTTNFFTTNSMFDFLISTLINECCYMVDYGNNAL